MTREMFTALMSYIEMRIEAHAAKSRGNMSACEELRLRSKILEDDMYALIERASEDGK